MGRRAVYEEDVTWNAHLLNIDSDFCPFALLLDDGFICGRAVEISCHQYGGVFYPQYTCTLCSVTSWSCLVCNNLRFSDFHFIVQNVQQLLTTSFIA
jgi:hypothetical protein